jgi:hypothetical protein
MKIQSLRSDSPPKSGALNVSDPDALPRSSRIVHRKLRAVASVLIADALADWFYKPYYRYLVETHLNDFVVDATALLSVALPMILLALTWRWRRDRRHARWLLHDALFVLTASLLVWVPALFALLEFLPRRGLK